MTNVSHNPRIRESANVGTGNIDIRSYAATCGATYKTIAVRNSRAYIFLFIFSHRASSYHIERDATSTQILKIRVGQKTTPPLPNLPPLFGKTSYLLCLKLIIYSSTLL